MDNLNIPAGYQPIMPYLIVPRANQFLRFLHTVFGAEEKLKHLREDGQIMHAEMTISGSTLMVAAANDTWTAQPADLFIYVPNADETYQKALAEGATSVLEPRDQDYGRTCGVKDPFGNTWWITSVR